MKKQSKFNIDDVKETRGYFFGNMYLSSIQQGIQAAHVIQHMVNERDDCQEYSEIQKILFNKWMKDKTIILLNGGNSENLHSLYSDLFALNCNLNYPFPLNIFCEDEQSLNNAWTSIGIILPDTVYDINVEDIALDHEDMCTYKPTPEEEIKLLLNQYKLAT